MTLVVTPRPGGTRGGAPNIKLYEVEGIRQLAAEGLNCAEIGRRIDRDPKTVKSVCLKFGITITPKPKEEKPMIEPVAANNQSTKQRVRLDPTPRSPQEMRVRFPYRWLR